MGKFAIIGLGTFGIRMMDELLKIGAEIIIIDQHKSLIEKYKNKVRAAHLMEEINEVSLRKFLSSKTDTVIVDFSRKMELSTLCTTILKNIGIPSLIPPEQIYYGMETYLFSLKNDKNCESKGLTDSEKIVNHGFDKKTSFRNM